MFACEVEVGTTKKRKRSGESVNETLIISDAGCRIPYIPGFSLIFEVFYIWGSGYLTLTTTGEKKQLQSWSMVRLDRFIEIVKFSSQ